MNFQPIVEPEIYYLGYLFLMLIDSKKNAPREEKR